MTAPADLTRVYAPKGKQAHLLMPGDSPDLGWDALCGMHPYQSSPWRGTGTQAEREKAAALPLCGRCEDLLSERAAS